MAEEVKVKEVVVIGGGYAGTACAAKLRAKKNVHVTLVDPREGMVHKIGGLRAAVDEKWAAPVLVSREKLLPSGKVVQGKVLSVDVEGKSVVTDAGALPFDFLVVATGAANNSPGEPSAELTSKDAILGHYVGVSDALKRAKDVVIIGGGVVGVELSGEVKHLYPETNVTVIHSQAELINAATPPLGPKFQKRIKKQMDGMGIKYVLGDKAAIDVAAFGGKAYLEGARKVAMASGAEVDADLVFLCVGTKVNNEGLPAAWLDEAGRVKVDRTLTVEGTEGIFAIGDVNNVAENKLAYTATLQGPVAAANILSLANGKPAKKKYSPLTMKFMIVPLGPKKGLFRAPVGTLGPAFASGMKGKSLFLSMPYGLNKQKTPAVGSLKAPSDADKATWAAASAAVAAAAAAAETSVAT